MKIIGIVGKTASGKSFIAKRFQEKGCKVFDADKLVHTLYKDNFQIIHTLAENVPHVIHDDTINKKALSQYLLKNKYFLKKLETLIYPILIKKLIYFVKYHSRIKTRYIVLDIPLLFKIKANYLCDALIYINTKDSTREKRILRRHQGNKKIFSLFPLKTTPDLEKYCNFTINAEAERGKIVYNVTELLKKISVLPNKRISVNLYSSILISERVRYFQNR